MTKRGPNPDGQAVRETREWIRDAYQNGATVLADRPAVTIDILQEYCDLREKTIQRRLKADPAVEKIAAIRPDSYKSTIAYTLAEDER